MIYTNPSLAGSTRLTFGLFEADLKSGELWKAGYRVKLQMQPFKVLIVLLENAGEVVSREEIQLRVWGADVSVDFEHSLGGAIKKVREALGDSAENPRFIETLSRRGYRFIAPVGVVEPPVKTIAAPVIVEAAPQPLALQTAVIEELAAPAPTAVRPQRLYIMLALAFVAGLALCGLAMQGWLSRRAPEPIPRISQITQEGEIYSPGDPSIETLPASASDDTRIFTSTVEGGRIVLSQISTATGQRRTLPLPSDIAIPEISDLSPDGSRLLVRSHSAAASEQPLWIVPVDGGSAFRVSSLMVLDATWMPDGRDILYTSGNQLSTISLETGRTETFATVPGRAFWLRWSPDGKLLRFTLIDPVTHGSSLWQVGMADRKPKPIREGSALSDECCGTWTADNKSFLFQATQDGNTDLWRFTGNSTANARQVTNGPLSYEAPAVSRRNDRIFFVGHDLRTRLERFDAGSQKFVELPGFLSQASRVSFSRDGEWVVWTNAQGHLWRAHADGSDSVRLTPESMRVFLATWSPDGSHLALMARNPGQSWQIYTISASGGSPETFKDQGREVGDPSYAPDGRHLVYGRLPDLMGQENTSRPLKIVDLATGQISPIAHSEGLFSPRWSPDGLYIAALTLDQQKVMLYDVAAKSWRLLMTTSAADPVWSSDSKSLFIHAYMADTEPIFRIGVPDGHAVEVVSLKNFSTGNANHYFFAGLSPEDVPLVRAEASSGNLYTMNLPLR